MFLCICRAYLNLYFVRYNDFNVERLQTYIVFLCIVLCHSYFFRNTTGSDRFILTSLRDADIFSIYVYWALYFNTYEKLVVLYFGVRACVHVVRLMRLFSRHAYIEIDNERLNALQVLWKSNVLTP